MKVKLHAGSTVIAEFDLGDPAPTTDGLFDGGALGETGGNLYIEVDGVEVGSLLFSAPEPSGRLEILAGAFDSSESWWTEQNPLVGGTA